MPTRTIIILFLIIIMIRCTPSSPTLIETGVSLDLAQQRKANINDLRYELYFDIPVDKSASIPATNKIGFTLQDNRQDLQIDFKEEADHILSVSVNEKQIPISYINEHIIIAVEHLTEGENSITISFIAGDQSLNRNDDYLYTLLVPDRARTVFPLFDQPNLKAIFKLELAIPTGWKAQANGPVLEKVENKEKTVYRFAPTAPISSYLFAFTAGAYQEATSEDGTMTMLYRETDIEKVNLNTSAIFDLHKSSLLWLEDYTQIDYPFQKFDFALIPSFQYGGMEHVGAIFYNERSLMLDEEASINQQLSRASLIAHETAHMWFGDLVTMDWFDDVWLKEVFANFMAAKMVNPSFPEIDHDLRFLLSHYPTAYGIDRSAGSHPIQQALPNLNSAGTLYGGIIYQKAPIVMRNLEKLIGKDKFQNGLQEYLRKYSYGNATWDDLISIMQQRTTANLTQWNTDWVKSSGMPTIAIAEKVATDGTQQITYTNTDDDHIWPQTIALRIKEEDAINTKPLTISSSTATASISAEAEVISYNYKGDGYGYFRHPAADISELLADVSIIKDDHERAAAWLSLWEELLHGRINRLAYLAQLQVALKQETNPLILNTITSQLSTIYWSFLKDTERIDLSPQLENTLWERLKSSTDNSIKRALYQCYVNIASSATAHNNLLRLWNGEVTEFKLTLSNRDKERLTYAISVRDIDGAADIYIQQIDAMTNPDDAKRMRYVRDALSPEKQTRDVFFTSLQSADNRSQERWVLTALSYLHHPLRQSTSRDYVLPSLELLEEIQITGDIFFPARWLGTTLGYYSDEATQQIVQDYLASNSALPTSLRNKVHQAADILMRAEMVREGVKD